MVCTSTHFNSTAFPNIPVAEFWKDNVLKLHGSYVDVLCSSSQHTSDGLLLLDKVFSVLPCCVLQLQ